MRPIGREGGGGIAQRGRSLISIIVLLYILFEVSTRNPNVDTKLARTIDIDLFRHVTFLFHIVLCTSQCSTVVLTLL